MCQSTSVCLSVCLVLSRKFDRSQKLISLSIRRYLVDWIISSAVFCADQRCCACILADIRLSPVHTSNNVEATVSNATSRTILLTKSNVASTLLPFLPARDAARRARSSATAELLVGNTVERNFVISTKSKQN